MSISYKDLKLDKSNGESGEAALARMSRPKATWAIDKALSKRYSQMRVKQYERRLQSAVQAATAETEAKLQRGLEVAQAANAPVVGKDLRLEEVCNQLGVA